MCFAEQKGEFDDNATETEALRQSLATMRQQNRNRSSTEVGESSSFPRHHSTRRMRKCLQLIHRREKREINPAQIRRIGRYPPWELIQSQGLQG